MPVLSSNSYGKSDVRLTKVVRHGDHHALFEVSVDVQLTGDFAAAYTAGDNRRVIATDSIKNTVYVLAKERTFDSPESFAALLADHFPATYDHVTSATVDVREASWVRINVDGKPHEHAFVNGGRELHTVQAVAERGKPTTVTGGVTDLLVLKTGQSAWKDFHTDRYRTLPDASDRIMATSVTATWDYAGTVDYVAAHERLRTALLTAFATHDSLGVQHTMHEMGHAALAAAPEVRRVSLRLPNKHRIPFNLKPFGLTNDNDIFVWTDEPFGDISCTVARDPV
jgi:urate oxidase